MVTFVLELYVPRERAACLDGLSARVQTAADELRGAGTRVRYLRSIYLPEDETCFVVAEASSHRVAVQLSERAALDSVRIVEATVPRSGGRLNGRAGSSSRCRSGALHVSSRTDIRTAKSVAERISTTLESTSDTDRKGAP